jgi:hypothetical protein
MEGDEMTKREMLETFPRVSKENDLLGLYLYDTQMGHRPNAIERERQPDGNGWVRVQLWRATGALGGYVVICDVSNNARIVSLDDANEQMRDRYDNYTLPLRLCLERLTGERNRLTAIPNPHQAMPSGVQS